MDSLYLVCNGTLSIEVGGALLGHISAGNRLNTLDFELLSPDSAVVVTREEYSPSIHAQVNLLERKATLSQRNRHMPRLPAKNPHMYYNGSFRDCAECSNKILVYSH